MIRKRLEILKGSIWIELELYDGEGIKYNSVINKMASTNDRSLSHSNTFDVPWTKKNIDALGLNVFNPTQLANALNEKYEAKYYVDDRLLQKGFVVINNMNNGNPSLNFIDEALTLVEKWGDTTYKEFLQDEELLLNIDSIYTDAINNMTSYSISKSEVLSPLTNISGLSYPVAYFPNTLNTVGDKFQTYSDQVRFDDYFNPYQSRPVFNCQAFLDMVTQAYGYTLVKHNSVDWDKMAVTAISADGLNQGEIDDSTSDNTYNPISYIGAHWSSYSSAGNLWSSQAGMVFPSNAGITPSSLPGFPSSAGGGTSGEVLGLNVPASSWWSERRIFTPNLRGGNVGIVRFYAQHQAIAATVNVFTIWTHDTNPDEYVFESTTISEDNSTTSVIDITIQKSQFDTIPTNGGSVVGIYVLRSDANNSGPTGMYNMIVEEEILQSGVVTYDDHNQIEQNQIDLTYAAPQKSIKELINGILQRFGALIDINSKTKQVEIFTYKIYGTNRYSGNYYDWTDYHQQYSPPNFNTNYGNNYAVKNKIGLRGAYLGNYSERYLGNQVSQSKLKEFAEDYNSQFSDITKLVVVNYTNNPYSEFSIGGASMVEFKSSLGNMTQASYDQETSTTITQGTISGVAEMVNVNYSILPQGQDDWYTLVDQSLRCNPTFLLPQTVIRNLDLKWPVYVDQLGGYYIIEEIDGYEDESTPTQVSLIKLPNDWGAPEVVGENEPLITYSVAVTEPNGSSQFNWEAQAQYTFNDFDPGEPASALWYMLGKDEFGAYTGINLGPFSVNVNLNAYSHVFPLDGTEDGYYETYLVTNQGYESSRVDINIGQADITEFVTLTKVNGDDDVFNTVGEYSVAYTGFTPTSSTHYLQEWNPSTQSPVGLPISINTSTATGNYSHTFPSAGTWKIYIESSDGVNDYISNDLSWTRIG